MSLSKTEGLVVRTRNLGEADKIITLITRQRGKLDAVARGSRRVRSRLLAVSQPFAHGSYLLFLNDRSLHTLSQGELIQPFRHLRENLTCLAYASYLAELADMLLPEEEPDEEIYETVLHGFSLLEQGTINPSLIARWYELHMLDLVGFRPELATCTSCHEQLALQGGVNGLGFSIPGGGVLCPKCATSDGTSITLNGAAWQTMRYLLSAPADKLVTFHPQDDVLSTVANIITAYIEFRLERRLNALVFLHSVEGL